MQKFKCIKYPSGVVLRLPLDRALEEIQNAQAHFVPKSCYNHFYNRMAKIEKGNNLVKKHDFSKNQNNNFIHTETDSGKTYAYLKVGENVTDTVIKHEEKRTKKLNLFQKLLKKMDSFLGTKFAPVEFEIIPGKVKRTITPRYQKFLYHDPSLFK